MIRSTMGRSLLSINVKLLRASDRFWLVAPWISIMDVACWTSNIVSTNTSSDAVTTIKGSRQSHRRKRPEPHLQPRKTTMNGQWFHASSFPDRSTYICLIWRSGDKVSKPTWSIHVCYNLARELNPETSSFLFEMSPSGFQHSQNVLFPSWSIPYALIFVLVGFLFLSPTQESPLHLW